MRRSAKHAVWLMVILCLEVAIYAPNFKKFFCGDSLFYLSRVLEDWVDVVAKFRSPDGLGQYRPLTYVLYSYVIYPIAGLNLFLNHLFPLLFHGANTVLAYFVARHVFAENRRALLAAFFFGVSTVGAYITYDNTFIPDYLYVFFFLGALLSLCRSLEKSFPWNYTLALVFFLLALLSKEAAVSFAAGALILLLLATGTRQPTGKISPGGSVTPERNLDAGWKLKWSVGLMCIPFALVTLAYIGWHLAVKGGNLYPSDPSQPHRLEISWRNVQSKFPALGQAVGLSSPMGAEWYDLVVQILLMIWLTWVVICTLRGALHGKSIFLAGALWSIATIAPALFVTAQTWEHNLYLPMLGLSWIFAQCASEVRSANRLGAVLAGTIVVVVAGATAKNAMAVRQSSWMAVGSKITENCLVDIRRIQPPISSNTLLYIEESKGEKIAWHFDSGQFPGTLLSDRSIRMRFWDDGRPAPAEKMLETGRVVLLKYIDGRLYDVTRRRRLEKIDIWSYRIRDHWKRGTTAPVTADSEIAGPVWNRLDETSFFPSSLGLNGIGRDTLVQVPGIVYSHPLPEIVPGSKLRIGVALASAGGGGVFAEVNLEGAGSRKTLYSRSLRVKDSPGGHGWDDQVIDLGGLQGTGYQVKLLAEALPGEAARPNWVEWGPLDLVPPMAQTLELPPPVVPIQPSGIRIHPARIRKGEVATIEVIGGAEMEIDCRYTLDSSPVRSLMSWLTTDASGRQQLSVNTPGHYVITAIRNALRPDWVSIYYEWDCRP
jgi:Dolichyl-phosphate-mannose-protein mannosyltransferase